MNQPVKKLRGSKYWCSIQARTETRYPENQIGYNDQLHKRLYSAMQCRKEFMYDFEHQRPADSQNPLNNKPKRPNFQNDLSCGFHGGIYHLSFIPDGSLLLAATENKAILVFDPFNHQLINTVNNAHEASVNYIKFLDDRLFASGSDDCTVSLWDIRNLKHQLRILRGHSYQVKNIEYDQRTKLLLSSGFDGEIHMWDINKYTPTSFARNANSQYSKALFLSCLMRMRMTHDNSKMIICTSEGYIMLIHDLDLLELKKDLGSFQSDLYRLMQKGHSCGFDFGSWFNPLFTAKRNRVELISDFPQGNESHSIFSLDVHPYNWSIVSRNYSRDERTEWTCVHDIQGDQIPTKLVTIDVPKERVINNHMSPSVTVMSTNSSMPSTARSESSQIRNQTSLSEQPPQHENENPRRSERSTVLNTTLNGVGRCPTTPTLSASTSQSAPVQDYHFSPVVIISARTLNRRAHATILNPNLSYRQIEFGAINPPKIFGNLERLTHYAQELNYGQSHPKDVCFSPDGRVICSPYENGFRVLAFDDYCSEMSHCVSNVPKPLFELKRVEMHNSYVVTTRFSPRHFMIAAGCLSGRVSFSQPIL